MTVVQLPVPSFNPANLINAPAGATHFRLINAIACVSDFAYNSQSGVYEPIDATNNKLSDIQYSDYTALSAPVADPNVVTSTLPGPPTSQIMQVFSSVWEYSFISKLVQTFICSTQVMH